MLKEQTGKSGKKEENGQEGLLYGFFNLFGFRLGFGLSLFGLGHFCYLGWFLLSRLGARGFFHLSSPIDEHLAELFIAVIAYGLPNNRFI